VKTRYYVPPIVGVLRYKSDAVVVRARRPARAVFSPRSPVAEFSLQSRRRLAFVAANTDVVFKTMVTLTYPREYPSDGVLVKTQLKTFLKFARRQLFAQANGAMESEYLWFLEFQARGAPHIHLLLAAELPRQFYLVRELRDRIAAAWYRIVGSDDERHLRAGTRCERIRVKDGGIRYAVKYAYKMRQKKVPLEYQNVGRFWGHSRGVKPTVREVVPCLEDDVRGVLETWPYKPAVDRPVYRVLYGASSLFEGPRGVLGTYYDTARDHWYRGTAHPVP